MFILKLQLSRGYGKCRQNDLLLEAKIIDIEALYHIQPTNSCLKECSIDGRTNDQHTAHNALKHEKIPISNVCLGDCMITSKAKINVFLKKNSSEGSPKDTLSEEKISKMLILVFEVIMQSPKYTFEIGFFSRFSSL